MILKQEILSYIKEITKNAYKGYELQLDEICKRLSIKHFIAGFEENISGMIKKNPDSGEFEIFVNRKHPLNRMRFTLAHEIGHYISCKFNSFSKEELEKEGSLADYATSYRKDGCYSDAETEANLIAATILMPEDKVKEMVDQELTIEQMADKFFVSPSAMTIRLQNLYPGLMVI